MQQKFFPAFTRFTKQERNGVYALLCLLTGSLLAPYIFSRFFAPVEWKVDEESQGEVHAFLQQAKPVNLPGEKHPNPPRIRLFHFDPNTASFETWLQLGIPARTAKSIVKYRAKGGQFRVADDLKKIYTLEESDYKRILPYVAISKPQQVSLYKDSSRHVQFAARIIQSIDINTADSSSWELLPGIGAGYTRRILKFRERLGGFHDVQQVGETYGLPGSVFNKIQPFLKLGDISLRKIDLNQADEKSLGDHPYINTNLARAIVKYRSVHGPFERVEDLKRLPLVDEINYRKIEYYIAVTKH
ncbi:DNA uptake protein ComE-like DNA-binding protein [Chitinophaga skermanii]|uniref:DNA uptake protein ComE-like DNA-binding protein n=1 Tax=Chitinophaga skermanii TaxID=331697 RepID=A0A327QIM6_9BACT|nr:helix-hairpin-helix domain-containing protein [Chitinophaga skermanii]RAJ04210.1 DNA uptake protein ComE-like DNA-binding protein [Chitinophaga skermanii]